MGDWSKDTVGASVTEDRLQMHCLQPSTDQEGQGDGKRMFRTGKNQGRTFAEVQMANVRDRPLLLAEAPPYGNLRSPERSQTQNPGNVVHPQTPAPWSKRRPSRLSREPAAGDEGTGSLPVFKVPKCSATLATATKGSGDCQAPPVEGILQPKAARTLHLQHPEKVEATDILENFLSHFLIYLHECPDQPYFRDIRELAPGDSYDHEQSVHPGSYEVQLSLPAPDCTQYTAVEGYQGLFYTLTLLKKSHSFPAAFLLEDGKTVSPRNIMEELWKHVNAFIKMVYSAPFPGWQVRLEKKKPNAPLVHLGILDPQGAKAMAVDLVPTLELTGQWPCSKKAKQLLEENLQPRLMRAFYFVAEQCPGKYNKETWRISFSHVEKDILNHHSSAPACFKHHGSKCCRNECLKMLQDLVDSLKTEHPLMLAPLSSYHIRMSFLHTLWEWKADTDWKPSEVARCFERALANFIQEVTSAQLSHFFLPKCNLFAAKFFPPTKLKFLRSHLKEKGGAAKMSCKRGDAGLVVTSDLTWPLMVTLGLILLVSAVLPNMAV